MKRIHPEVGEFVHAYSRGVDKRIVFLDEQDFARFFFYAGVLNHDKSKPTRAAEAPLTWRQGSTLTEVVNNSFAMQNPLADLCAFVQMGNHVHLLLREIIEGGIAKFMQRLFTAYTMYFNERYERTGALFEGRYKSKIVETDEYLEIVLHYLHANPLPILRAMSGRVDKQPSELLSDYFWSSYSTYASHGKPQKFVARATIEAALGSMDSYAARIDDYAGKPLSTEKDFAAMLLDV